MQLRYVANKVGQRLGRACVVELPLRLLLCHFPYGGIDQLLVADAVGAGDDRREQRGRVAQLVIWIIGIGGRVFVLLVGRLGEHQIEGDDAGLGARVAI